MILDYSTLQAGIAAWLARADLTSQIPTFIQLGEARINRELRVRKMQLLVTGTATGQTIPLPDDLRDLQSLYVTIGGKGEEIFPLTPSALADRPANSAGIPQGYVVVGDTAYLIGGQGDLEYTLVYIGSIPTIATTQNWLIQREPGMYLYSALMETAPYMKDDARMVTWAAMYKTIYDAVQAEDDQSRYGNAPSMRSPIPCAP